MLKVIKNQKYQTCGEVKKAAALGRRYAILSSIRHWNELATAPVKDLTAVRRLLGLSVSECALCERYDSQCYNCPLYGALGLVKCYESGQLYAKAFTIFSRLIGSGGNYSTKAEKDAAVKRFRRIAEKMVKVLEGLL